MADQIYVCVNDRCPLGPFGAAGGRFVGGITKEGVTMLTGDPDPQEYGEGYCTNCGQKGEEYDPNAEKLAHIEEQLAALNAEKEALS